MKVLITGGLGYIGSYTTSALLKRGEEVALLTTATKSVNAVSNIIEGAQEHLSIIRGNITDPHNLMDLVCSYRPDCIIHLAAITGIRGCLEKPSESFNMNVQGTFNVALAALKVNAKIIFASSREVYGETRGVLSAEDDPLLPNNLYGLTKVLGEDAIKWFGKKNLDFTILRFTNVYGPRGDQYNVQAITLKALKERKIDLLGGAQVVNLVYVEDAVNAILTSFYCNKASKEVFNVGSYDNITVRELVCMIADILNKYKINVQIIEKEYLQSDTMYFKPNIRKIMDNLGWKPQTDLNTGLSRTVEYYLKVSCLP